MEIKPILFNTEMVRAILDGRKTCTRRVIKPQWEECPHCRYVHNEFLYDEFEKVIYCARCGYPLDEDRAVPCQEEDILYVRETWSEWTDGYLYKAWNSPFPQAGESPVMKWHPSIHMPKEAARIWLKVTNVRVERLQDITEDGAKAEGANWKNGKNVGWEEKMRRTAVERFAEIWESTIKKSDLDRYGWDANPYVFVIEFVKIDKPEEIQNA